MAEHWHPDLDWMPNRSLNNCVTKLWCNILPFFDLMTNEKIGTFGRLLLPSKNRFLIFKSLCNTFWIIWCSLSFIVWAEIDSLRWKTRPARMSWRIPGVPLSSLSCLSATNSCSYSLTKKTMPPPNRCGLDEAKTFSLARRMPEDPGPPTILCGDKKIQSL